MYANKPQYMMTDNIEYVQLRMMHYVSLLVGTACAIGCWMTVIDNTFNAGTFIVLLGEMVLCFYVYSNQNKNGFVSKEILVISLVAVFLLILTLNEEAIWMYIGIPIMFIVVILRFRDSWRYVSPIVLAVFWLDISTQRAYDSGQFFVILIVMAVLIWKTMETLYTALHWVDVTQKQANDLLDETIRSRGELLKNNRVLETTNQVLLRTQKELELANKHAEEARRLKEQFAANISHELRTPLNLILGFTEIMHLTPNVYGTFEFPAMLRRDIYQIYRNSRHLLEMIDDILDLSRFELSSFSLQMEPTPIGELIEDSAELIRGLFKAGTVEFETHIDPNLPVVSVDRTRIRQVIVNLLTNAHRFTASGFVRLSAHFGNDEILVSVEDTGKGISESNLSKIFDEFYQVDYSFSRNYEGTGLGLALSRKFVESHGGKLQVRTELGLGSIFTFTLPVHSTETIPISIGTNRHQHTIIVVDPGSTVTDLLQKHLKEFHLIHCSNAKKLTEMINQFHPIAIIENIVPSSSPAIGMTMNRSIPIIRCSIADSWWVKEQLQVMDLISRPVTSIDISRFLSELPKADHILVVDDDRGFVQLVERMLQSSEYQCDLSRAYTVKRAWELIHQRCPDLILLDANLSATEGIDLLQQIKSAKHLRHIPVVMITASGYVEELFADYPSQLTLYQRHAFPLTHILNYVHALSQTITVNTTSK
ncbi:MAG: hybrid sensor histidine kinase/response regulator [Chloroflexi bacterium]|nr:hybrid sensor histidine kinase/response regulator [Chloroflexota bacterium]